MTTVTPPSRLLAYLLVGQVNTAPRGPVSERREENSMHIAATSSKFAIAAALGLAFGAIQPAAAQHRMMMSTPTITPIISPNIATAIRMATIEISRNAAASLTDRPGVSVAENQPADLSDVDVSHAPSFKYDPYSPRVADNKPDVPVVTHLPWNSETDVLDTPVFDNQPDIPVLVADVPLNSGTDVPDIPVPEHDPEDPEDPEDVVEDDPEDVVEDDPEDVVEDDPEDVVEDDPEDVVEDDPEDVVEDDPEDVVEDDPDGPVPAGGGPVPGGGGPAPAGGGPVPAGGGPAPAGGGPVPAGGGPVPGGGGLTATAGLASPCFMAGADVVEDDPEDTASPSGDYEDSDEEQVTDSSEISCSGSGSSPVTLKTVASAP